MWASVLPQRSLEGKLLIHGFISILTFTDCLKLWGVTDRMKTLRLKVIFSSVGRLVWANTSLHSYILEYEHSSYIVLFLLLLPESSRE